MYSPTWSHLCSWNNLLNYLQHDFHPSSIYKFITHIPSPKKASSPYYKDPEMNLGLEKSSLSILITIRNINIAILWARLEIY
jgi:hypothetical protein